MPAAACLLLPACILLLLQLYYSCYYTHVHFLPHHTTHPIPFNAFPWTVWHWFLFPYHHAYVFIPCLVLQAMSYSRLAGTSSWTVLRTGMWLPSFTLPHIFLQTGTTLPVHVLLGHARPAHAVPACCNLGFLPFTCFPLFPATCPSLAFYLHVPIWTGTDMPTLTLFLPR